MLAVIHWNIDPILIHIGNFELRYYGLCWALGFLIGYILVKKIFIKENIESKYLEALFLYVFLGALIGARLGHCLFYDWEYFSHHILEIFLPVSFIPSGVKFTGYAGLASHGGAIGVILAVLLYNRKYHIPILSILDKLAFATPVLGALIRIGNFFNSEIIGAPTNVGWAVVFDRVDALPRHPAQLYEAFAYIISFIVLCFAYRYKYKHGIRDGLIFGLCIMLIFVARFFIEYCKEVQESFEIGLRESIGMDMGQILSIPFIIVGLFYTFRSISNPTNKSINK
ncbi:MAG: prolipoprotein diacylglyceryl transferase [Bacteroidales bacterium]|nr:prolipoprotein diacylglyceryl transferase [Bacteroidales bacterium]MDY2935154.1 prolipoprotein diacylglyceryl transferase [Candidatus Cryptobacteroides sp.]